MIKDELRERCKGRWRSILMQLGVPDAHKTLSGRNVPCPMCGGKDRFHFSDRDGAGIWYCNNCLGGDGFKLLMAWKGVDFREAARLVEEVVGKAQLRYRPHDFRNETEEFRQRIAAVWRDAKPLEGHCQASFYLQMTRKIEALPLSSAVRFLQSYPDKDPNTRMTHYRPTMVSRFIAADSSRATLHFTYLNGMGEKADTWEAKRFAAGAIIPQGGAVRFGEPAEEMGVSTGLETTLSIMELAEWRHLPVWAALTDGQLAKFDPPPICRKLHIFCDNDKKFCGLYSGVGLGYHLGIKRPGIDVEIHYPTGVKDYNDLLRARKSESNVVSLDEARRREHGP